MLNVSLCWDLKSNNSPLLSELLPAKHQNPVLQFEVYFLPIEAIYVEDLVGNEAVCRIS